MVTVGSQRTVTPIKWTIQDYHRMVESGILAGRQVELLNGEIVEMSPEGPPHAYFRRTLADYLRDVLGNRAAVLQASPISLPDGSEPEPDIAIVQPLGEAYLTRHPYPEDVLWVIEFANSSLGKDLEDKRQVYAAANLREYWVVNLQAMQLIVFREPQNGDYQTRQVWQENVIAPLSFQNISIPVRQLLRLRSKDTYL